MLTPLHNKIIKTRKLALRRHLSKSRDFTEISSVIRLISFFLSRIQSGPHIAFRCHVSLDHFIWDNSLFLICCDLESSESFVISQKSHDLRLSDGQIMYLGKYITEVMLCPWCILSGSYITGKLTFFTQVRSARPFH